MDPPRVVVVESRTEFLTEKVLTPLKHLKNVELALGLEVADDEILRRCVNKGNYVADYIKAATLAKEMGFGVRTYLMLKPILLDEQASLDAAVKSIEFAAEYSDIISLNPMYVHKNTLTHHMAQRGEYTPPRLWTLVEVLRRTAHATSQTRIISDPTAGGTRNGAHNCRKCDRYVMAAIEAFSLHQDAAVLDEIWEHGCACQQAYGHELALEAYSFAPGGLVA